MESARGFTVVEVLVVIVVLAIIGSVSLVAVSSEPRRSAIALAERLRMLRYIGVAGGGAVACIAEAPRGSGGSAVVSWPPGGLLFTPDGLPRACDGGGVGNATILLEHRGRRAAVIVSSLGRVRWEPR